MVIILPLLTFVLLALAFAGCRRDLRAAFLAACVVCGTIVAVSTELLGAVENITRVNLIAVWSVCAGVSVALLIFAVRRERLRIPRLSWKGIREADSLAVVGLAVAIVIVEAVIALRAPPNTWDCMSYHLSRVAHWISRRSVAFYPTHILRQNHQMPGAEFAILHLQVLSGGDRFANIVQWLSMVGSVLGVSLIARELGGPRPVQWLGAIVCLTVPMGILQATSSKNDYVLSLWSACLVVFLMRTMKEPSRLNTILCGFSLGLALLTKGTAYVYAAPLILLAATGMMTRRRWQCVKTVLIVSGLAFIMSAPHYSRNLELYGSPLGPGREGSRQYFYTNERITPPIVFANIVRNAGLHLGTGSKKINSLLEEGIYKLLGSEVNNPASTWGKTVFHIRGLSTHEETAGNPVHLVLTVLGAAIILLCRARRAGPRVYVGLLSVAALSFCTFLRWQPWHNRLHLPLFVLSAPVVALGVSRLTASRLALNALGLIMMGLSLPWLLANASRPLIGSRSIFHKPRIEQYFVDRPRLLAPYCEAVTWVVSNDFRRLGLIVGGDDYEYPFWVLLRRACQGEFRIEHVGVRNGSQALKKELYQPEAIIATVNQPDTIEVDGREYTRVWARGSLSVFRQARGPVEAEVNSCRLGSRCSAAFSHGPALGSADVCGSTTLPMAHADRRPFDVEPSTSLRVETRSAPICLHLPSHLPLYSPTSGCPKATE